MDRGIISKFGIFSNYFNHYQFTSTWLVKYSHLKIFTPSNRNSKTRWINIKSNNKIFYKNLLLIFQRRFVPKLANEAILPICLPTSRRRKIQRNFCPFAAINPDMQSRDPTLFHCKRKSSWKEEFLVKKLNKKKIYTILSKVASPIIK